MWHREMKWSNIVGKMELIDLLDVGLPQTFNLWNMQYLQSVIKWSAINEVHLDTQLYHRTVSLYKGRRNKMLGVSRRGRRHWFWPGKSGKFLRGDNNWAGPSQVRLPEAGMMRSRAVCFVQDQNPVLWPSFQVASEPPSECYQGDMVYCGVEMILFSVLFHSKTSERSSGRNDPFFSFGIILFLNSHYWGLS